MAKPKRIWPPCARCGTPDGYIPPRYATPQRYDGVRLGYNGKLCAACYNTVRRYPHAKLVPTRHVPHRGPVALHMADAILAFSVSLTTGTIEEQAFFLSRMVTLAEEAIEHDTRV